MPKMVRVGDRRAPCTIARQTLDDERLGWTARGMLAYLHDKPDDWSLRIEDLRRRGDLGRDAV